MADGYSYVTDLTVHPERIVSLSPSNTEILFAIGAGDKVVGVTDHCNYPAELEAKIETDEIARVGGYWNPSVEAIVDLKPDLVLVSTAQCTVKTNNCKTNCSRRCELTTKVANRLKSLGLNVLTLSPHSMDNVLDDLLLMGNVTGNSAQASDLVETLKHKINAVVANSKTLPHEPTVYFEVWNSPYISVNSKTWIGNLINLAGGKNIFEDAVSEWPVICPEDIIQRNPDIIVFPVIHGVPRFWGSFKAVKKRLGWENITAVRDGRLYEVPRDFISRPGPRLVEALELLEKMINPIS
ncbi:cobalamin-binding protein [Candidatus Bathyarchaeota archaeon]|nr:cobalamin-binding protein [Candidatus Bathyarchaeota archaeon]